MASDAPTQLAETTSPRIWAEDSHVPNPKADRERADTFRRQELEKNAIPPFWMYRCCEDGEQNAERLAELIKETKDGEHDINYRDPFTGYSCLEKCCAEGWLAGLRLMLDAGADESGDLSPEGLTPLHLCARGGHVELARILLDLVPVNAGDHFGETALDHAAACNRLQMATLLLERGADPLLESGKQQNASAISRARGDGSVAALIEKHGNDVGDAAGKGCCVLC